MNTRNQDRALARPAPASGLGNLKGLGLPLLTVIGWGGSFPIAKAALPSVNALYLSAARYVAASLVFAMILWAVEGKRALRFEGQFVRVFVLGSTGFAGFGLLAFLGLTHTRPQNAALLLATMPLLTILILWVRHGTRPHASTMAFMFAAVVGVTLVITRGSVSLMTSGRLGTGDLMVLLGTLCWVIYMLGASSLPSWSPLRYTTLSALAGTATILAVTVAATAAGFVVAPSLHETASVAWEIAYLALPGTVIGVLTWNAGIKRLGPQNTVLFINVVPVIALAIEMARGYHVTGVELVGVTVTLLALIANNLWQRRTDVQAKAPPAGITAEAA